MVNIRSIAKWGILLLMGLFILFNPIKAQAQTSSICGQFKDEGYYFLSFYFDSGSYAPTYYTLESIMADFGYDPATSQVWLKFYDPTFNRSGVITGFSSYEKVSSCGTTGQSAPAAATNSTLSPANRPLNLDPDCINQVKFTYSDLPYDWQINAQQAMNTWNNAGSAITIAGYNSVTELERVYTVTDYAGDAIKWYPVGTYLHMAKCEIRAILASDLHDDTLSSVSKNISALSQLPAWVMPYTLNQANTSIAGLVILNDYNFSWSTSDTLNINSLDAQSLITHELGHSFGIYHTLDNNSVMSGDEWDHLAQLWLGVKRRYLSSVDTTLLLNLYGYRPQSSATSGAIIIGDFCVYKYGSKAIPMLGNKYDAYTWSCYDGSRVRLGIDMNEVCRSQHPDLPYAVMGSRSDAYSWSCVKQ